MNISEELQSTLQLNENLYHKGVNGTAVLILHGYTSHIRQTDILFEYLKRKGYTVVRPIMPGHDKQENDEELEKYGPVDWLDVAQKHLQAISKEAKEIYVVGMSFGGNIALSLCNLEPSKIKGVVTMEMPVQFVPAINWAYVCILPFLRLVGIKFISKDSIFYKKRSRERKKLETSSRIPLRMIRLIRKHIVQHTKKDLKSIKKPCLFIQAQNSNVLSKKNAEIIFKNVSTKHKRLYLVDINNHDLNLMDDEGKMLLLEEVYEFINHLTENAKKAT